MWPWDLQGQITVNNWQQFVPTLLIVLTTIIYIPLSVVDIIQQVCWDEECGKENIC
jgi:hypothetical protein